MHNAGYMFLLRVRIGSLDCLRLLSLAGVELFWFWFYVFNWKNAPLVALGSSWKVDQSSTIRFLISVLLQAVCFVSVLENYNFQYYAWLLFWLLKTMMSARPLWLAVSFNTKIYRFQVYYMYIGDFDCHYETFRLLRYGSC